MKPEPLIQLAKCGHCGADVPPGRMHTNVDTLYFCCAGCQSVYELLRDHKLCDYYDVADLEGIRPTVNTATSDDFALLDTEEILERFIEWKHDRYIRLRFHVPNMHCASCVWLLDQLHRFDDGITASTVDFLRKTVVVDFDRSVIAPSKVAVLLARLGYSPLLNAEQGEKIRETVRKQELQGLYRRIGVAGFAFGNVMMISIATYAAGGFEGLPSELRTLFPLTSLLLSLPVLLYSAQPWFRGAWFSLRHLPESGLSALNLDVPVALGMTALFVRSVVDVATGSSEGFFDSFSGLVFFLLIGRLVLYKAYESISFERTYRSFFPLSVRTLSDKQERVIPVEHIQPGDVLLVRNSEVIPADSELLDPVGYIDYAFVTGESRPVECLQGQVIHAGGRVIGKGLRFRATTSVSQSHLAALWERSGHSKPRRRYQALSDRFGKWFTVGTMLVAFAAFVFWLPNLPTALTVFTSVLIIACPCALTIAAPVTFGTAMARLGLHGMYLKSPDVISELLDVDVIAFDKTGTLTQPSGMLDTSQLELHPGERELIYATVRYSTHPVARALAETLRSSIEAEPPQLSKLAESFKPAHSDSSLLPVHDTEIATDVLVTELEELPGKGVRAVVNGVLVQVGSSEYVGCQPNGATHVNINGRYAGSVRLNPKLREEVEALNHTKKKVLISGDSSHDAELFRPMFGDEMWFDQSPTDKVDRISALQAEHGRVLMVGDGLNDASAFATADVSIAVTDQTATIAPASDILMKADNVRRIPELLRYANRMRTTVWISAWFTGAYNAVGLALAVSGMLTPLLTAILMPISSLVVIGISVGGAHYFDGRIKWE